MISELTEVKVPWGLTGALVVNLIGALATTAVFHPELTPIQRLENSMTSFVLLDLGDMLAAESCAQQGLPKGSMWIHKTTQGNLQQLSGFVSLNPKP